MPDEKDVAIADDDEEEDKLMELDPPLNDDDDDDDVIAARRPAAKVCARACTRAHARQGGCCRSCSSFGGGCVCVCEGWVLNSFAIVIVSVSMLTHTHTHTCKQQTRCQGCCQANECTVGPFESSNCVGTAQEACCACLDRCIEPGCIEGQQQG
jgi:hypothetical protein